jgi:microcin C transport system permease protein
MLKYILKRLLFITPTLFGISLVTFLIVSLAPGGPVEQKIQSIRFSHRGSFGSAAASNPTISPEILLALKREYGFDKSLSQRYFLWIKKLIHFDFGESYIYGRPALAVISERAPVSLQFGAVSFFLTYSISIILGLLMAKNVYSSIDRVTNFILICLAAIPIFIFGTLLLVFLAGDTFLHIFPVGYLYSDNYDALSTLQKIGDRIHHFILPLVCYVAAGFTTLSVLTRNSLLNESGKDYVRTARAKGLNERIIYFKHILRNALIPLVTGLGGTLTMFLSGSLLVESVFQIQGLGLLSFQSVISRDYNVIMALLVLSSLLMLLGNLVSDVLYVWIDPRVRLD